MAKRIAMFNHKGGVSKTTTTFNVGWMLASTGRRVVLVDADPQCNLTGSILGYQKLEDLADFYSAQPYQNIHSALEPAFSSQPREIKALDPVSVDGVEGLFLIPGHIGLAEYELTLGIAQELSSSIQALQNLPGSFSYFFDRVTEHVGADYLIIDMNPGLGAINQNLVMTSDFFIVPASPDFYSVMAMDALANVLPRWSDWSRRAQHLPVLEKAAYPFPKKTPKFLGTILQRFRPRNGNPTKGFQQWIDSINIKVKEHLAPRLLDHGMLLDEETYRKIGEDYPESFCLAQIPDFNTLIAKSQEHRTPVFALTDEMLGHVGVVLEQQRIKRDEFRTIFSDLAARIIGLTNG